MKNLFLVLIIFFGISSTPLMAQDISSNAIGFRLESDDGLGPEISYQRALGGNNRIELDLGFRDSRHVDIFKLTATYQWVWNLTGGLNWFAGVGGGVGFIDYEPGFDDDSDLLLTADGIVGLEYSFRQLGVPIQIALDINPEIRFMGYGGDNLGINPAFSIRFQF